VSNRIIHQVHRLRDVKGPARAVLLVLADEARDYAGGRSSLTTAQIADRTGLSRRTVHRAYVDLINLGHITREPTAPGAAVSTIVHPGEGGACPAVAAPDAVAEGSANLSAPPCQSVRGSYSNRDIDQIPHTPTQRAREPAAADQGVEDPVGQVFAAWDGWLERCGLPGPVTRTPTRRAAVAAQLAEFRVGQLLQAIDRAERGYRSGKFNRQGQGDLWFTFDKVFEVAGAKGFNLLARLLDGEFGAAESGAAKGAEPVAPATSHHGEGPAEAAIRATARAALGESTYRAWLEPAALRLDGDELVIITTSRFAADHIANQITPHLRRPGLTVRVVTRTHAPA
jgi:AcrR family transcriptional regulator